MGPGNTDEVDVCGRILFAFGETVASNNLSNTNTHPERTGNTELFIRRDTSVFAVTIESRN